MHIIIAIVVIANATPAAHLDCVEWGKVCWPIIPLIPIMKSLHGVKRADWEFLCFSSSLSSFFQTTQFQLVSATFIIIRWDASYMHIYRYHFFYFEEKKSYFFLYFYFTWLWLWFIHSFNECHHQVFLEC